MTWAQPAGGCLAIAKGGESCLALASAAVNEGYRRDYGAVENDSEFVHLFGGDLDVWDAPIVEPQWPRVPRQPKTEQEALRSMRLTLEAAINQRDATFDPRAFQRAEQASPPAAPQTIDKKRAR